MAKANAGRLQQVQAAAQIKPRAFGVVVRDQLIERGIVTAMGNPNWAEFALKLKDVHYETLRKAVTGDRWPGPKLMEDVAAALGVDPALFYEYQLWQAQRAFDPKEVGADAAYSNLRKWVESQGM
jgi:hypothetical protein